MSEAPQAANGATDFRPLYHHALLHFGRDDVKRWESPFRGSRHPRSTLMVKPPVIAACTLDKPPSKAFDASLIGHRIRDYAPIVIRLDLE